MADSKAQIVLSAQDLASPVIRRVQSVLGDVGRAANYLAPNLVAITSALTVGSFAAYAAAAVNANAALDDMAESTGATVESLSAIVDIARIGGHDMGTLEAGMMKLSKALAEGDDEARATGHALAALGLRADDLRKMDTGNALLVVAKALDGYADSGGKSALAMDLLGKSGAKLLPFLKDLAEKGELVAKVTGEQAGDAERLQKNWNALKVASDDLGRSLAGVVVPALNDVFKNFNAAQAAGYGFFQSLTGIGVRGFLESQSDAKNNALANLRELGAERDRLAKKEFKWFEFGMTPKELDDRLSSLDKRIKYYRSLLGRDERLGASQSDVRAVDNALIGKKDLSGYKSPETGKSATASKVSDGERYLRSLQDRLVKEQELTEVERLQWQLSAGMISFDTDRQKSAALAVAGQIDAEKEWGAAVRWATDDAIKANNEWIKTSEENVKRLRALLGDTDLGKFDKMLGDIDFAETLFASGKITQDQLDAITAKLFDVSGAAKDAKSVSEELGLTMTSAFEEAVIGGRQLSDVLRGLAQDIVRIGLRKSVTEPIGTGISKAIDGFDWSRLWPFESGGVMTPGGALPLHSYATGGIATGPQLALFGEGRQNEAFVPLPDGRRIPVQMSSGGGVIVQQSITVNAGVAQTVRAEMLSLLPQFRASAIAGVVDARRRGGSMSRVFG